MSGEQHPLLPARGAPVTAPNASESGWHWRHIPATAQMLGNPSDNLGPEALMYCSPTLSIILFKSPAQKSLKIPKNTLRICTFVAHIFALQKTW